MLFLQFHCIHISSPAVWGCIVTRTAMWQDAAALYECCSTYIRAVQAAGSYNLPNMPLSMLLR